ncbi:hypothetical protein HOD08_01425 [bacterium]|nr:hypothetical protein [bacterium]
MLKWFSSRNTIFIFVTTWFVGVFALLMALVPAGSHFDIDSSLYLKMANDFSDKGVFGYQGACCHWMGIGYPVFILFIKNLFGSGILPILLAQLLIMLATVWLLWRTALRLFSQSVTNLSVVLAALTIGYHLYPQFILTEALMVFLISLGLERFTAFLQSGKMLTLMFSGFAYGVSIWLKSSAWYLALCLIIFPIFFLWDRKIKKRFLAALVFGASFFVPVTVLYYRNYLAHGHFKLPRVDQVTLYMRVWPKLKERVGIGKYQTFGAKLPVTEFLSGKGWEKESLEFRRFILEYPIDFLIVVSKEIIKNVLGLYTNHLKVLLYDDITGGDCSFFIFDGSIFNKIHRYLSFGTKSIMIYSIGVFEILWNLIRIPLILFALISLLVMCRFSIAALMALHVVYFLFIGLLDGCARYRIPAEGAMIILSALGIMILWRRFRQKYSWHDAMRMDLNLT